MMKMWEMSWTKLLDREGIEWLDHFRYIDDSRTFTWVLMEGWFWNGVEFEFSESMKQEHMQSNISDLRRTTTELTKAMSSVVSFLKFEGEDQDMFSDSKLPTLDTAL